MGDQQRAVDWAHEYKCERDEFEAQAIQLTAERDKLLEDKRRLVEALEYWIPKDLPLQDQHDSPSEHHKINWHKHQRLLAELGERT